MNELCICLQYIGDNGPCPIHGNPLGAKEAHDLRLDLAPKVLKVFTDEQLLAMTSKRNDIKIELNPQNKGAQP